jgi:ketol-acid reductoisomerase
MSRIYHDDDVDTRILSGRKIAVIGFGNQGSSHALNLRDSGQDVIIGNIKDKYARRAVESGFSVKSIKNATRNADIICMLVPDEVQSRVYRDYVKNQLTPGKTLMFASGFNVHFGFINPPKYVDVVMEAPRMIGVGVRELYLKGLGCATLFAVHNDYTGNAKKIVLAIAKAIGATRLGAFESSFREEAVLDLFSEQAFWAAFYELFKYWLEIAAASGYDELVAALELYCSGEMVKETKAILGTGVFRQMSFHSTTSQYGSITRGKKLVTDQTKRAVRQILKEIETGDFAQEWVRAQRTGARVLNEARRNLLKHRINKIEDRLASVRKEVLNVL